MGKDKQGRQRDPHGVEEGAPQDSLEEGAPLLGVTKVESDSEGLRHLVICVAWAGVGIVCACYFENWTFLTGLYVTMQIITTVGYGDVVVTTQANKLFCSFYVLGTVLILGTIATNFVDKFTREHTKKLTKCIDHVAQMQELKQEMERKAQAPGDPVGQAPADPVLMRPSSGGARSFNPVLMPYQHLSAEAGGALSGGFIFLLFAIAGTVFYGMYESCTCSYGVSHIEGCQLGERCAETGGAVKTWIDAWYLSLVTLTTVGFGDNAPKSMGGRVFAIFWMLFGVVATANFCSAAGQYVLNRKHEERRLTMPSKAVFDSIGSKDGTLSRDEFLRYTLVKFSMVDQGDVSEIDRLFNTIDESGDGQLSYEEVARYCDAKH